MKWKLQEYLERNGITAHQLALESKLSLNSVYPAARGEAERVSLATLDRMLTALDSLTGKRTKLSDVLEREEESEYEFVDGVPDDITERIKRFEAGETTLRPWHEVRAELEAERKL
jgi:hypothetical protein